MNTKRLFFILVISLSLNCLAQVSYNLEDAKKEVLSNNTSLAVAYENYVRAQEESRAITLELLPQLSADLFLLKYQFAFLRLIIPEPTRYFSVKASRKLAEAASLNRLIVKRNILEDFEKKYFLYQMHKSFVPKYAQEVSILEEVESDMLEAYELGAVDFAQYYEAKNQALNARDMYLNAEQMLSADEITLKAALGISNHEELQLEKQELYNEKLAFPDSQLKAIEIALHNSKELDVYDYTIAAAREMKKGVAISWLSWGGIGLDYFTRNSIAKSKIRILENEKKKATYEMKNQVAKFYKLLENQHRKIEIQEYLVGMANSNYDLRLSELNDLRGTKIALKKAELSLLAAQRELESRKYELELLYIGLKRILGTTMISNSIPHA